MINKLKILMFVVLAAIVLWSAPVYAEGPEFGSEPSKEMAEKMKTKKEELYKELNLTEEQKKALEENKNKNRAEFKALAETMRAKRDLMREELQKDALNMDRINQIQSELKQIQSQMSDQRLQGILEVRKVLTPEQFKKFSVNMQERKGRFGREGKGLKDGFKKDRKGPGAEKPEGQ